MQDADRVVVRYELPKTLWVLLGLSVGLFVAGDLYAIIANVAAAFGADGAIVLRSGRLASEVAFTLFYAVITSFLQLVCGTGLAVSAYYMWGMRRAPIPRLVYCVVFVPYFVPIAALALLTRNWAIHHRLEMGGGWGWVLLVTLSVWQFYPFVFFLVLEQLRTISHRSLDAVVTEGGSFREVFNYLVRPKLAQVIPSILLLRVLWMYTKVDLLAFLFEKNSSLARSFAHFEIFDRFDSGSIGSADTAVRSVAMIAVMSILIIFTVCLYRLWSKRDDRRGPGRCFQLARSGSPVTWSASGGGALRITLMAILAVTLASPLLLQFYCAVMPSDLITVTSAADLCAAWWKTVTFGSGELDPQLFLGLRWCLQSLALGIFVSAVYTAATGLLAYCLHRDRRLSGIGRQSVLRWIPVVAYAIPIIAIAQPVTHFVSRVWPCDSQFCSYGRLAVLQGFYLWPFCLWLAFQYLATLHHRSETALVAEEAGLARIVSLSLWPHFWRRAVVVFLLALSISFNEFVFATYTLQTTVQYTIQPGIYSLKSVIDTVSPAPLFVVNGLAIMLGFALAYAMGRFVEREGHASPRRAS